MFDIREEATMVCALFAQTYLKRRRYILIVQVRNYQLEQDF